MEQAAFFNHHRPKGVAAHIKLLRLFLEGADKSAVALNHAIVQLTEVRSAGLELEKKGCPFDMGTVCPLGKTFDKFVLQSFARSIGRHLIWNDVR